MSLGVNLLSREGSSQTGEWMTSHWLLPPRSRSNTFLCAERYFLFLNGPDYDLLYLLGHRKRKYRKVDHWMRAQSWSRDHDQRLAAHILWLISPLGLQPAHGVWVRNDLLFSRLSATHIGWRSRHHVCDSILERSSFFIFIFSPMPSKEKEIRFWALEKI